MYANNTVSELKGPYVIGGHVEGTKFLCVECTNENNVEVWPLTYDFEAHYKVECDECGCAIFTPGT